MSSPLRHPHEETIDLYPGLVVDDGRVTGSITFGRSRVPLWAVVAEIVSGDGYDSAADDYGLDELGWTDSVDFVRFLVDLLNLRGEFARLLLVLADAERDMRWSSSSAPAWWETKRHRERVGKQLRRCLSVLED